jgi:hypothetical protein
MNEQELIIEQFHACTGVQKHLIHGWYNSDQQILSVDKDDITMLMKQIEECGLQKYSKPLLRYMEFQRGQAILMKGSPFSTENWLKQNAESQQIKLELLNFLEKRLTRKRLTQFHFTLSKNNAYITNSQLINIIADTLTEEFIKRGYNITPLSIAEVEKIYNEKTDEEWFKKWKQELDYYDNKGNPVSMDDFEAGQKYYSPYYNQFYDTEFIKGEMFHVYAQEHTKKRDIDLKLIKQLKAEPQEKKEVGRKGKNKRITQIAFAVADLSKIDEFINNSILTDIDNVEFKNATGNLIYELLVKFGFFEDKPARFNANYKPHNYIKMLLKNKLKSEKFDFYLHVRKERLSSLKAKLSTI